MALEAKKLCECETKTEGILAAAIVLSFWKIVPLIYSVNNYLMRREKVNISYIYIHF